MGKQHKIKGANVRALLIFRQINKIQQEGLNKISIKVQNLIDELAKKNEIDYETANILRNVYFKNRNATQDKVLEIVDSLREEIRKNKRDGIDKILLFLSSDGDLYRKPKDEYCYTLKSSGKRLGIIRFLIGKEDFVSGEEIKRIVGTTYGTVTNAISEINTISKLRLNLPENQFLILSRDRGGYKLNPLYPITQEV